MNSSISYAVLIFWGRDRLWNPLFLEIKFKTRLHADTLTLSFECYMYSNSLYYNLNCRQEKKHFYT